MKVDVKKLDALTREMKFEVPKDRVNKALEEVYGEISKVAKVRGFRPGKVPRHVLENSHGAIAREEAIKKIIPEVYHEGIEQHKLNPLDLPEILDVSLKDGILKFTAKLDIRPEVKIENYKGIKVTRKSATVTDEELSKTLEFLKKGKGQEEITIDDSFARQLGYPNLEEFKQLVRRQLEIDKDRQNRIDVENQIVEHLLKNAKLIVPQSMVKRQMEYRINEAAKRLKSAGMPEDEIQKKLEEGKKDLQQSVERDVKVYLVLQAIAEAEKIHTHREGENLPAKVMEFLFKEAQWEEEKGKIITKS